MRGFTRALFAGLLFAVVVGLAAGALGAGEGWVLPLALATVIFGSLFDREGFYGDPHPFRRRTR